MKNEREVVLDRAGLIQLAGGMFLLLTFGFTAGAVVGFGVRGGGSTPAPAASTGGAGPAVTSTAATERCEPAQPLPMREADAGIAAPPGAEEPEVAPFRAPVTAVAQAAPEPEVAEPPAADASIDDVREKYAVQLGVFGVEANAKRLASDLRRRGYDPLVAATRNRSGQWLKRVSLAVYDSEAEAELAAQAFKQREGLPAVVVAFREEEQ